MSKIKNILIFVAVASVFVLIYIFFIKSPAPETNLVTTSAALPNVDGTPLADTEGGETSVIARDFITLLLNVKNIKLNDQIFFDPAFFSLRDSSIILVQDGNEGRPNPFAQFGAENAVLPNASVNPPTSTTGGGTPATTPKQP